MTRLASIIFVSLGTLAGSLAVRAETAWWNPAWTVRQPVTIDTGADAAALTEAAGDATVLVRLSDANFRFASAREDGSDLRFISGDGKTVLPHQIESYDNLLNEGFVWVKLPGVKAGTKETIMLYSGNAEAEVPPGPPASDAHKGDTSLVYHFNERATPPADATSNNNTAQNPGAAAEGSLIGNGVRLLGTPIIIPNSPTLVWKKGQQFTLSLWIKPAVLQDNAVIFSRGQGADSFRLLLDQAVPVIQLGTARDKATANVPIGTWSHLGFIADGSTLRLFLNGTQCSSIEGFLPALNGQLALGGTDSGDADMFTGEFDELSLSNVARSPAWIKFSAANQGAGDTSQRTLSLGEVEGGAVQEQSHLMEHLSLFRDIAGNMMFDGWIAIGICAIMIAVGWTVAIRKFLYLNSIEKGTKVFLGRWKSLSSDLTALDQNEESSASTLAGQLDSSGQAALEKSPLFHIYQIGSEEIRHRITKDGNRIQGLNGRSIQAIRASLDAGLVHESHRLSDGLVYLTISIAGGPYVGLLGTVVGVMITFAIIARSGEVNVNSIAPGIASALLATVVGLVVAIPALFIYSYLNGRIKNSLGLMQVFIDEFVAKMAEFYRPPNETDYTGA